ncbi:hypothetical protein HOI26_00295 [Candidatus Woesearchaeota archaeon]|jgi:hypothetical protein|nr:hypothetical protein [Candidatus Woesearchaeota archaeon]MBT5739513.1 hypothetical protein [Candidatus Woesearchaeota archaeon]
MNSENLAYWLGVAQTDGYLKKQFVKSRNLLRYLVVLDVGFRSLPMLKKFRNVSDEIFGVKGTIWENKKRNTIEYKFGAKNLLPIFDKLKIDFSDPPKPPRWVLNNEQYFGAYLAGVIDGDGDVRIRRPKYPQCVLRITSGKPATELMDAIKQILNIGASQSISYNNSIYQGRRISGKSYRLEFCVSSKNSNFFKDYVAHNMALKYKRDRIINYISNRQNSSRKI